MKDDPRVQLVQPSTIGLSESGGPLPIVVAGAVGSATMQPGGTSAAQVPSPPIVQTAGRAPYVITSRKSGRDGVIVPEYRRVVGGQTAATSECGCGCAGIGGWDSGETSIQFAGARAPNSPHVRSMTVGPTIPLPVVPNWARIQPIMDPPCGGPDNPCGWPGPGFPVPHEPELPMSAPPAGFDAPPGFTDGVIGMPRREVFVYVDAYYVRTFAFANRHTVGGESDHLYIYTFPDATRFRPSAEPYPFRFVSDYDLSGGPGAVGINGTCDLHGAGWSGPEAPWDESAPLYPCHLLATPTERMFRASPILPPALLDPDRSSADSWAVISQHVSLFILDPEHESSVARPGTPRWSWTGRGFVLVHDPIHHSYRDWDAFYRFAGYGENAFSRAVHYTIERFGFLFFDRLMTLGASPPTPPDARF